MSLCEGASQPVLKGKRDKRGAGLLGTQDAGGVDRRSGISCTDPLRYRISGFSWMVNSAECVVSTDLPGPNGYHSDRMKTEHLQTAWRGSATASDQQRIWWTEGAGQIPACKTAAPCLCELSRRVGYSLVRNIVPPNVYTEFQILHIRGSRKARRSYDPSRLQCGVGACYEIPLAT
jgi:hypothetical protein